MALDDAVVKKGSKGRHFSKGGDLLANLALIDIKTWQTSQEVWRDWNNEGPPILGVNTANLAVYRLVDNKVVFDLLGREGNPFVDERFQKEAYDGIVRNDFFSPKGAMKEYIAAAIQPSATVCYSGLRVQTEGCHKQIGYVVVDGKNIYEEERLFERVYIQNSGRRKRIYLLREEVVRKQLQGNEDEMIVRACYFGNDLDFEAIDNHILSWSGGVRGVPRAK